MVSGPLAGSREALNDVAADIATTLAVNTMRFDVIERAQLDQLLREQKLEGIVKPGELAQQGQVRGVDYLLIGKITNLRVKRSATRRGFGLSRVDLPWGGGAGAVDYRKEDIRITTECGVDIRLVNPSSGSVAVAHFSDYNRTDTAKAIGLEILGASAEAEAELEITEDDKGKILRLALDDALRKMLPKVDNYLRTLNP